MNFSFASRQARANCRVLGQEPVAGMNRGRLGPLRGVDHFVDAQITFARRIAAERDRLVGVSNEGRRPVAV